jgi:succinoglycan biosynthesis protein ExoL
MKILFLNPSVNFARFHKRTVALHDLGMETNVLAFQRDPDIWRSFPGGFTLLGNLRHGNYLNRARPLLKSVSRVRSALRMGADVLYVFGLDMAILGLLSIRGMKDRPVLVYEVGDIREVLLAENPVGRAVRMIEKRVMRKVDLLVVTSAAYVKGYYRDMLELEHIRYFQLENKLDRNHMKGLAPRSSPSEGGSLRIGYFGVLRCEYSWNILKSMALREGGRISVYVRGIPRAPATMAEEAQSVERIDMGGPYISPEDLPDLYQRVDMVWAAGYHGGKNYRWARRCRFYEACFYRKPLIAQTGTEDGRVVDELGIGCCVDAADTGNAIERISNITGDELETWRKNLARLPETLFLYTDDHRKLLEKIRDSTTHA